MRLCLALALILGSTGVSAEPAQLKLLSKIEMDGIASDFGGLSALIVQQDGQNAHVLNDRGHLFDVWLNRDDAGVMQDVTLIRQRFLYLVDPDIWPDTEGLALAPDGSLFISFERPLGIARYVENDNWPKQALQAPEIIVSNENRGLEALAIDGKGRLVTLPEAVPSARENIPIFRLEDDQWTEIAQLPNDDSFLAVGADFDPQGRFYLLERAVSLLGFRSRIRRLDLSEGSEEIETIWQSSVGEYDNLEGLSIWTDATGQLRLTLVSDNNFLHVQETQLLEFVLTE